MMRVAKVPKVNVDVVSIITPFSIHAHINDIGNVQMVPFELPTLDRAYACVLMVRGTH